MRDALTKTYKMRPVGDGGIEVTIPSLVIRREARRHGITATEFRRVFRAIAHFNSFDGVYYTFAPKEE